MIDVTLVEAADRLLGTFSHLSSGRALRTLTRRGVAVVLGTGVDHLTADGVHLADGRFLPARTVVWAAGVTASAGGRRARPRADAGRAAGGRRRTCRCPAGPRCSPSATSPRRPTTPGSRCRRSRSPPSRAADTPPARSSAASTGLPGVPFRYHDKGSMATIGRNEAVTELPFGIRLWGFVGWLAWLGLHLIQLMGFRNRANVLVNWAWNYVTYDRGARLLAEADREDP